ncbi:response regulator [Ottowia testudinis]|uniref:Response regulator n=1 Tax=Ottowia testudinis TaxID=2816950 RepID=A0A975H6T2_9BURK|nr:response regulator [Ottowia testudinis]QTD46322.1 response regulator [Ottowia testudinis]
MAQRDAVLDRLERQILILANGHRSADALREMMGPSAAPVIDRLLERRLLMLETTPAPGGAMGAGAPPATATAPSTLGDAPSSLQFANTEAALQALTDQAGPVPAYHADATVLRVYAGGLKGTELQLLRAAAALSQRQRVSLTLLEEHEAALAEVVMLAGDTEAMRQRLQMPWMDDLPIVWLGGGPAPEGEHVIPRPVPWVRLPTLLGEMLSLATPTPSPAPARTQRKPRVLIVDDSLAVRRHLAHVLANAGLELAEADSGEAALIAFKEDQRGFDCVLLDVMMPGIDGYDTCRALKHTYVRQREPAIIMLTSRSSPFDRIRGKFAGCDAYLGKPVDVPKLMSTLGRFVALAASGAGGAAAMPAAAFKTT